MYYYVIKTFQIFAENIQNNAVHGADSDENAKREASFHFAGTELFDKDGLCIGYL